MKIKLFLIFGVLLALLSCEEEENLPPDDSSMGEIATDRRIIGTNQQILLACPVTMSTEATDFSIQWEMTDGTAVEQDSYENGISYKRTSWEFPGAYTFKCKVKYYYGSELKNLEKSYSVQVKKCHFQNSFIGDDIESVKKNNPQMEFINEGGSGGYIYKESDNLEHFFRFQDGTLEEGMTFELKTAEDGSDFKAAYNFFMVELKKYENEIIEAECYAPMIIDERPPMTAQEKAVVMKFRSLQVLTEEERIIIGTLLENQRIDSLGVEGYLEEDHTVRVFFYLRTGEEKGTYIIRTIIEYGYK